MVLIPFQNNGWRPVLWIGTAVRDIPEIRVKPAPAPQTSKPRINRGEDIFPLCQ